MLRHIPCGSSWLCYHFARFIRFVPCFWRGRYCKFILAQRGIYVYSAYMHCIVLWRCRYCELIWPSEEYMKPSVNSNWSYSPETVNSGQNWRFLLLQFDRWPKKKHTAPFLYNFKIMCNIPWPSVNSTWSYRPETPVWFRICDFFALKFDGWPWKTIGHLPYATRFETVKLDFYLCDLDLWPPTMIFCMDIISVNGNNS